MNKLNKKSPILFYIGLILLAVVLISAYMVSGLYPKYTSMATGSDSARVAKFDVTNNIDSHSADIRLNFFDADALSDSFLFTVESKSEVSLTYDVVVTLPEGTYEWLNITLDGEGDAVINKNEFTFEDVDGFEVATNKPKQHTLVFAIKDEFIGNSEGINDIDSTVTVTVHVEQVD